MSTPKRAPSASPDPPRLDHGVDHGEHQDGQESGDEPDRHHALHGLLGPIHGGILAEFIPQQGQQAENQEPKDEISDGGAKGGKSKARVVVPPKDTSRATVFKAASQRQRLLAPSEGSDFWLVSPLVVDDLSDNVHRAK